MAAFFAPSLFAQQGSIRGTVTDSSGASVVQAKVVLSLEGRSPDQETQTGDSGDFSFAGIAPGDFTLSITAKGFASKTSSGELGSGQALDLPAIVLAVDTVTTEVNVTRTQTEVAEAQIEVQEHQRLIGILPNFFVSYDRDAAPLNARQKLQLTTKTWLDPAAFVVNGIIAGVWQAENTHPGFGQGASGYAKRYGASFADYGTSLMLENFVTTTLFKQDPRYFYKGTGTKRSRALYAVSRTFICRGDNKRDQLCYSSLVDRFGTGFVTQYYFPAADRDSTGTILQNSAIGIGIDAAAYLFQEFIAPRITQTKIPRKK
jgi:hypothetical protein